MTAYYCINVKDYGAKGDGQTDDTAAIQAAFSAAVGKPGATVFIPAGVYMVGSYREAPTKPVPALQFAASGCKLTGGGTLKHIATTIQKPINSSIILRIGGDRNVIEWIRIDGNYSGGATTNTNGYTVAGDFNRSRDVHVFNVPPETGEGQPRGGSLGQFGTGNVMHRCTAIGGYESLRDGGEFGVMRYCIGLAYGRKGYNNASNKAWTCVIGCHMESGEEGDGGAGYQIDPEDTEAPQFVWATFRDCTGKPEHAIADTTNGAKFAVIQNSYLNGCQFVHAKTTVTTLRIAERVDRCRVKDTFLARDFFFESNLTPFPEEVRLERVWIGNGTQDPNYAIGRGRCDILTVSDSLLVGYKLGGIEWRGPDGTYTLIAATNCDFNGVRNGAPTFDIDPTTGGQLTRSRKTQWLGNRRKNDGTGSAAEFTDSTESDNILGTTQDASLHVFANSAKPTSNLVTWAVGDIVMNDSPASPGYIGWVCTSAASPPGTWKEWGAIS